ncbi:MAG: general stress protein [Abditibacteriaceae bacterium]
MTPLTEQTQHSVALTNVVTAIYDTHIAAEDAIRRLEKSGFEMKNLSIVAKDFQTEEDVVGYYNTGDRMKAWGKTGAFWGGLWGMLFGSAFFFVPGVGPLLVAGPLVAWIVGTLETAIVVGGLSALGAGLVGMGIPKDSALRYETQVKAGKFLVLVHGTPEQVATAKATLSDSQHQGLTDHEKPSS